LRPTVSDRLKPKFDIDGGRLSRTNRDTVPDTIAVTCEVFVCRSRPDHSDFPRRCLLVESAR
jgi:hypothetical protein